MSYIEQLDQLLEAVAIQNASDLHLTISRHPTLRIDGALIPLIKKPILKGEDTLGLIQALLSEDQFNRFLKEKELDFSYSYRERARFRVNVFFQKGYAGAALRLIPAKIKTIEELNLPPMLHEFARYSQGFFLVVGPTGHGKTTTLAALVDEINHQRDEHIITIEDPIEYLFSQSKSIINQREVGIDTLSFHKALRSMFREDIDVAMIGEMRDPETMAAAVTAAETGHLVFSTLHTNSATQTVDRIIDSFSSAQQPQIRIQLAATIIGIVSQRLIPRISGGLIPAVEIMIANSAIRNLIRENKTHQLDLVIDTSSQEGMVSLNRSLADLTRRKEITLENAMLYSQNPSELRLLLKK